MPIAAESLASAEPEYALARDAAPRAGPGAPAARADRGALPARSEVLEAGAEG